MRVIVIDGKTYGVRLPTGGETCKDNEWDRALAVGCPLDIGRTYTWCQENMDNIAVCRGAASKDNNISQCYQYTDIQDDHIGFRPVLVPLEPRTLLPITGAFAGQDGQVLSFGHLHVQTRPCHVPSGIVSTGDDYGTRWAYDEILFMDSSSTGDDLRWAVFDGKLIAVDLLIKNIDFKTLSNWGFCDSTPYDCRTINGRKKQTEPSTEITVCRLAGKYVLLATNMALSNEEEDRLKDTDKTPNAFIAVKESCLMDWIDGLDGCGHKDLDEFLASYTGEDIMGLEEYAEESCALAFTYCKDLDDQFLFPAKCAGDAMLAFADFLSQMMQNAGHEEASKYLDCIFEF